MKKIRIALLLLCFVLSVALVAGCSGKISVSTPNPSDPNSTDPSNPIHIEVDVDFTLNIDAEDGKDANGFLWEHNYSEITITGYIGSENELTVPNTINGKPVTLIKNGAMKNFTGLKSIVIPGSVKSISGVFQNCTGLEQVIIAEKGLENMTSAFEGCFALKTVNIPSTVTAMTGAFENCSALAGPITVPEGVTDLDSTFRQCKALKKVTVPQSVTKLYNTFSGCTALEEVNIPTGVTVLNSTFKDCQSLKSIQLPAGITELEDAFSGCSSLEDIVLPDSLTILRSAFANCTSLRTICIPSNISYSDSVFRNCTALETVTFADLSKTPALDSDMFDGCTSLKSLELPEGMRFTGYGCIALENLTIRVKDNRDPESDEDNYIHIDMPDYVTISNLPSLKTLNFVSSAKDAEIRLYNIPSKEEVSRTEFTGSASWYDTLLAEAQLAKQNGYRYYSYTLDDGTSARLISKYDEDNSWTATEIPTTSIESNARLGNQIIYTDYSPALIGNDLVPGVICYKSVTTEYLWCSRPEASQYVSGTETYATCEYPKSITINGIEYPVNP